MRLYGRKFASQFINKKLKPTTETSDGIIFEVDWSQYVCKCRIQGSDEYIDAHFPRNEATIPSWMKPGNAVRLLHRSGIRGHVEVIGHGGAIPTPQPGSPSHPATSALADGVISGLEITAAGGMTVAISAGTYRINGIVYEITGGETGYAIMSESDPPMTMNETWPPAVMGDPKGANFIVMSESDPPMTMSETWPQGTFQVGTDGVIDYLKGTAAQSYPAKPAIDTNHIQIGEYILVVGGYTEITDGYIGKEWTVPYAAELILTGIDDFYWDAGDNYPETNLTVSMKNQYGYTYSDPRTFTLTMIIGTGQVWSAEDGYDALSVEQEATGTYTFKYQRDQTDSEMSPSFMVTASGAEGLAGFHNIILYDVFGVEIERSGSSNLQTVTSSGGAATIDWSEGINAKITMTEDVTFTFSNAEDGDKLTLLIRQNATGGWTPTFPAGVKYGDQITAANLSISSAVNSRSYIGFIYDASTSSYDLVANVSGYV
jgi:hypothetical protein